MCSDFAVRLADGSTVPCSRFLMATACGVVRRALEDGVVTAGVLPLPGVSADAMRVSADLVHGLRHPEALPLDDVLQARTGLDYLDCGSFDTALATRQWDLLKAGALADAQQHVVDLIAQECVRDELLSTFMAAYPRWAAFKPVFDEICRCPMWDACAWAIQEVLRFYPPLEVLKTVAASHGIKALESCDEHVHPLELEELVHHLSLRVPAETHAVLDALHRVSTDYVPAAGKMYGSAVVFDQQTLASVCVTPAHGVTRERRKVSAWLTLEIERGRAVLSPGFIRFNVHPKQLGHPERLDVRVTCTSSGGFAESWWIYENVTKTQKIDSDACQRRLPDERLAAVLRGRRLLVRVDVFWGASCAL